MRYILPFIQAVFLLSYVFNFGLMAGASLWVVFSPLLLGTALWFIAVAIFGAAVYYSNKK